MMLKHIRLFSLLVVSLMLTTFISCTSRTKIKKTNESASAVKKDSIASTNSSNSTNTTIFGTTTKTVDDYAKNNNLSIEYNPMFDTSGTLIPFHYSKDINGQKTTVNIIGNAKVTDITNEIVKKSEEVVTTEFRKTTDSLNARIDELEYKLTQESKTVITDVKVAPDYLKYIIWLAVLIFLLAASIIGVVIYFKATIGKYKKLLL